MIRVALSFNQTGKPVLTFSGDRVIAKKDTERQLHFGVFSYELEKINENSAAIIGRMSESGVKKLKDFLTESLKSLEKYHETERGNGYEDD